jgi:hypothetical protein
MCMCVHASMCVCIGWCVYVCACACACACARVCMCVCVCEREREREREQVRGRERERERVSVCVPACLHASTHGCSSNGLIHRTDPIKTEGLAFKGKVMWNSVHRRRQQVVITHAATIQPAHPACPKWLSDHSSPERYNVQANSRL